MRGETARPALLPHNNKTTGRQRRGGGSGPRRQQGEAAMAAIIGADAPLSETEHRTQLNRAVVASTVGTTIEWYDFFLYSTVTGFVFSHQYFPEFDPVGLG